MLNIFFLESASAFGKEARREIQLTEYAISVSFVCENRLSVLSSIAHKKPDAIIFCASFEGESAAVDLETLQEIRKAGYMGQILVISGRHSREVCRAALDCDAEWVLSAEDELDQLSQVLHRMEQKKKADMQQRSDRIQRAFTDLIRNAGRSGSEKSKLLLKEYENEELFQTAIIRILPPHRKRVVMDEDNLIVIKGYEMLLARLDETSRYLHTKDGMDILVCLVGSSDELETGKKQINQFLTDMLEFNLSFSHCAVWACMGSQVSRIHDINVSYDSARELLNERIIRPCFEIIESSAGFDHAKGDGKERFQIFDTRTALVNSLETFEEISCHKALMQLKSNIVSTMNFRGKDLFSIYKSLMSALFRELERKEANLTEEGMSYESAIKEYDYLWNIDDVIGCIENYYLEGISLLKMREENNVPAAIVLAKRYIRAYFNMPLTLQELSSYVGMNENYFSVYFKKCTSMSFKKYQTDLRIRHSKQMLLDKRYTMEDISDAVGYSDVKYFLRVFKQSAGITAGEYRKKYHVIND